MEYVPSLPEIVLGLGGIAIAAVIVMVGLRALRFLPESLADADLDPQYRAGSESAAKAASA